MQRSAQGLSIPLLSIALLGAACAVETEAVGVPEEGGSDHQSSDPAEQVEEERIPFYFSEPPEPDLTPRSAPTLESIRADGEALFAATAAQSSFIGRVRIGESEVQTRSISVDGVSLEEFDFTFYAIEVLEVVKGGTGGRMSVRVFALHGAPPAGEVLAFAAAEDGDLALLYFLPIANEDVTYETMQWSLAELREIIATSGQEVQQ